MTSVIEKFGGVRPMAAKLNVPPSTVKSWDRAGKFPRWRHPQILEAAKVHGIAVRPEDLQAA